MRVAYTGVCGTDLHHYDGWDFGDILTKPVPPAILGHEFSGTISAVGEGVGGFRPGDRVTAQPQVYCGACEFCQRGSPNMCTRKLRFEKGGSWAEYIVVSSRSAFKIPDGVSMKLAALSEPLGCSLRAVERAQLSPGDSVFIAGGGSVGLMLARLCRSRGAGKIFVSEPMPTRRALAQKMGADFGLDPSAQDVASVVLEETAGMGPDVCFEAAGLPVTARQCIDLVRRGGTVVVMGVADPSARLELRQFDLFAKELTIKGTFLLVNTFERCLQLLPDLGLDPIVTHVFPLEEAPRAVETAKSGQGTKVLLRVD